MVHLYGGQFCLKTKLSVLREYSENYYFYKLYEICKCDANMEVKM